MARAAESQGQWRHFLEILSIGASCDGHWAETSPGEGGGRTLAWVGGPKVGEKPGLIKSLCSMGSMPSSKHCESVTPSLGLFGHQFQMARTV